ncbi:MAG TPA: cyclic nucleotide-binding and patatin-like phospholipase domain-containing protein [Gemmatimonadaceae bacterium]|nr:cyclic nucleotide-binding and patatin-like phospholipase domain-containing protein [Gemmatimonadaceae bacterium]
MSGELMNQGETVLDLLRQVPLFGGLDERDLREVIEATTPVAAREGEWLFRHGDPGDSLYVVESGSLEAVLDAGLASERVLTVFGPGDFFGEMALLTGEARSAAVRAMGPSRLLSLGKSAFETLVRNNPQIALRLSRVLSSRLSATNEKLSGRHRAMSVVIVFGSGAEDVLRDVTASMERQTGHASSLCHPERSEGKTLSFASLRMTSRQGEPFSLTSLRTTARDGDGHLIVALSPADVDEYLLQLRELRHVWLLAADASSLGEATRKEAELAAARVRTRLAYTGERGALFPRSAGGLPALRIVRADGPRSVDAFARALLGVSVGVALSGGAAQGTAHVGVLEALVAAGVPIDMIAGTSGGALYGSLLASGLTTDQVKARVVHNTRRNLRDRSDYTIPTLGVMRGASIERMIHESTGGARFEDLHFPLYAVAADLQTGEEVVVETGPVSHGVRASISVPGIFEPFTIAGRVLVDGGVVNPLPVSVCREKGADFVIAVSVPAPGKLKQGAPAPGKAPKFNILSVIVRSYYFAGDVIANANAADADVLIKPSVEHFGWRDYKSSPSIIEAGRIAGEAAIARIRERLPLVMS